LLPARCRQLPLVAAPVPRSPENGAGARARPPEYENGPFRAAYEIPRGRVSLHPQSTRQFEFANYLRDQRLAPTRYSQPIAGRRTVAGSDHVRSAQIRSGGRRPPSAWSSRCRPTGGMRRVVESSRWSSATTSGSSTASPEARGLTLPVWWRAFSRSGRTQSASSRSSRERTASFDVHVNGELVFTKSMLGRYPQPLEVVPLLRERLSAT
jgi:hypothetical protein